MRVEVDAASLEVSAKHDEVMGSERFIRLLEEMLDLKIQQQVQSLVKSPPELAHLVRDKRQTDRHRLDQIRAELIRLLQA